MSTKPKPGEAIRVLMPGRQNAVDYVVIDQPTQIPDAVRAARPSRKYPGDFFGGVHTVLLEWIVLMTHPKPNLLPLSENLRDLLEALAARHSFDWASQHLWSRASGLGLVGAGGITDFGRLVLDIDQTHGLHLSSRVLGRSPIAGGGSVSGSNGRCTCGEKWKNNERPTKGGHTEIKREHREHVTQVLQQRIAEEI